MSETLLSITPDYLYFHQKEPKPVSDYHRPYFLVFGDNSIRKKIIDLWKKNSEPPLSYIENVGEIEEYRSFWDFNKKRKVFRVYSTQSYHVPEITDYLFFHYNISTAEHDIPYHQRALVDLAAEDKAWLFDSNDREKKLKILVYDIELAQYREGDTNLPIDIIGYADTEITFSSSKNLETEDFKFDILDITSDISEDDIVQVVSHNIDEEIENLLFFINLFIKYDIISGHNIVGFDNRQLRGRIEGILKQYSDRLSSKDKKVFERFLNTWSRVDKSFHFGIGSEVTYFYPCSFDTYLASRKFYPYLESHSLKAVAPFLGVGVKDRLLLKPSEIKFDERTLKYNRQDILEQMGITVRLIQQGLPLSFTTCMPFETLLPAGAVNMWDHMALIRGAVEKKIMPATCKSASIAEILVRDFSDCKTKQDIVKKARGRKEQLSKEFIRVVKYGDEMPDWVEYPYVIVNPKARDSDERLNYHMPGGMTIKPDKDTRSHFIPWWHVIVADVGAMYPTILKALNIGADTIKLCKSSEEPDMWIWLKKLPTEFFDKNEVKWKPISKEDFFADKGYKIGIKIDQKPGVVNRAMTGIMSMISQIKKELKKIEETGNIDERNRLKMMYQSVKGARNAGTHGILSAPTVSGRQFNLWGAAAITTEGQIILADTLRYLQKQGIRVVYGDTDGIYLGCSRSVGNLPRFSKALGVNIPADERDWLTKSEDAIKAIEECNNRWRKELNYPSFELEPEVHDAMIFVKHKNYLIFDEINGKIEMITKGNNFKGSDKANIARKVLKDIMIEVLRENARWVDEEEARIKVKESIKAKTIEILSKLDLSKVDIEDLTLVQSVKPAARYKKNMNGSLSTFGKRAIALEKLLGEPIRNTIKLRFVVTKHPLPGIKNPSKSGVKPIDYMYPVDLIKDKGDIDLDWYKKMIENYIQGAFGLSNIEKTEQTGLDAWM
ncbi:MAG: DNA polymerase elongation subunit (family B) [Thermoplasmata archaeon]|nr:MAG: DNA polymerase elongation subunit (family B) [Thermoplasmata archaeon]